MFLHQWSVVYSPDWDRLLLHFQKLDLQSAYFRRKEEALQPPPEATEAPLEPQRTEAKHVPLAELLEERGRRKEAQARMEEMERRFSEFQARTQEYVRQVQQAPPQPKRSSPVPHEGGSAGKRTATRHGVGRCALHAWQAARRTGWQKETGGHPGFARGLPPYY